jgi:hypothetical protein
MFHEFVEIINVLISKNFETVNILSVILNQFMKIWSSKYNARVMCPIRVCVCGRKLYELSGLFRRPVEKKKTILNNCAVPNYQADRSVCGVGEFSLFEAVFRRHEPEISGRVN